MSTIITKPTDLPSATAYEMAMSTIPVIDAMSEREGKIRRSAWNLFRDVDTTLKPYPDAQDTFIQSLTESLGYDPASASDIPSHSAFISALGKTDLTRALASARDMRRVTTIGNDLKSLDETMWKDKKTRTAMRDALIQLRQDRDLASSASNAKKGKLSMAEQYKVAEIPAFDHSSAPPATKTDGTDTAKIEEKTGWRSTMMSGFRNTLSGVAERPVLYSAVGLAAATASTIWLSGSGMADRQGSCAISGDVGSEVADLESSVIEDGAKNLFSDLISRFRAQSEAF